MRIGFAAALALLLAAPALAASSSTIHVGLVVTGSFASPLVGTWESRAAARGSIYHFVVSGSSGLVYKLVSLPLREPAAGTCDLRVSGLIYSLERRSGTASSPHSGSSYQMQYAVQSAEVVTSSTSVEDCREAGAAYLGNTASDSTLILSRTGDGHLIDSATGTEYIRTP